MSSIKNTQINGDVSVGRNVSLGGAARVAGNATIGHNLKVEGWLDAPNVKGANKGVFVSEAALKAAYPHPEPGWFAGVGTSTPLAMWVVSDGAWVAGGGTLNVTIDNEAWEASLDVVRNSVVTEQTARSEGDAALQDAITEEAAARASADEALRADIEKFEGVRGLKVDFLQVAGQVQMIIKDGSNKQLATAFFPRAIKANGVPQAGALSASDYTAFANAVNGVNNLAIEFTEAKNELQRAVLQRLEYAANSGSSAEEGMSPSDIISGADESRPFLLFSDEDDAVWLWHFDAQTWIKLNKKQLFNPVRTFDFSAAASARDSVQDDDETVEVSKDVWDGVKSCITGHGCVMCLGSQCVAWSDPSNEEHQADYLHVLAPWGVRYTLAYTGGSTVDVTKVVNWFNSIER